MKTGINKSLVCIFFLLILVGFVGAGGEEGGPINGFAAAPETPETPEDDQDGENVGNVSDIDENENVNESVQNEVITTEDDLDTTSPVIELIRPRDSKDYETSKDEKEIDFKYKVSNEFEIIECRLIIENDVEETDTSIERNIKQEFENVELDSDEKYDWYVECEDEFGNIGKSEEWDFDIDYEKPADEELFYFDNLNQDLAQEYVEENNVIILEVKGSNESKGLFSRIISWFIGLFAGA